MAGWGGGRVTNPHRELLVSGCFPAKLFLFQRETREFKSTFWGFQSCHLRAFAPDRDRSQPEEDIRQAT